MLSTDLSLVWMAKIYSNQTRYLCGSEYRTAVIFYFSPVPFPPVLSASKTTDCQNFFHLFLNAGYRCGSDNGNCVIAFIYNICEIVGKSYVRWRATYLIYPNLIWKIVCFIYEDIVKILVCYIHFWNCMIPHNESAIS